MGIAEATHLPRPAHWLWDRLDRRWHDLRAKARGWLKRAGLDLWDYDLGLDSGDVLDEDELG